MTWGNDGIWITAAHVPYSEEGALRIDNRPARILTEIPDDLSCANHANDWCLLVTDEYIKKVEPMTVTERVMVGDEICYADILVSAVERVGLKKCIVTDVTDGVITVDAFYGHSEAEPGNSGAGVFDKDGSFIGIVLATHDHNGKQETIICQFDDDMYNALGNAY